ncbi:MAG: hypothetical protein ACRCYY_03655 [Trueperaceae bacterium]
MDNEQHFETLCLMGVVAIGLTMLTLDWYLNIPFSVALCLSIFFKKIRTHWLFWTCVCGFCGAYLIVRGIASENAFYLFFYVSLTFVVATLSPAPYLVFGRNAHFLIGFVFLFATLWKIISPDFLSGAFMTFMLVSDNRLGVFGILFTPLTFAEVVGNRELLLNTTNPTNFVSASGVAFLAQILTWSTFLVEGSVALAFLTPLPFFSKHRDYFLIFFLLTAYVFVPVPAFAMTLALLGYAQTKSNRVQFIYKLVFVLMPLSALRYYIFDWPT